MTNELHPDLSLIIPVYNGADLIERSIRTVHAYLVDRPYSFEIIVVDDGSTDQTSAIGQQLSEQLDQVFLVSYPKNRGKFGAIKAGMAKARGRCRLFTDADLPYELASISYMVRLVCERQFHIVIGDRTLRRSSYLRHTHPIRQKTTVLWSLLVRMLITGGLFDTQCGLKAFRADVADCLFPLLRDDGFSGDVELLWIALKYNLEIKRVPVRLERQGPSSVKVIRDGVKMARRISRLRRNWLKGYYHSEELWALADHGYEE